MHHVNPGRRFAAQTSPPLPAELQHMRQHQANKIHQFAITWIWSKVRLQRQQTTEQLQEDVLGPVSGRRAGRSSIRWHRHRCHKNEKTEWDTESVGVFLFKPLSYVRGINGIPWKSCNISIMYAHQKCKSCCLDKKTQRWWGWDPWSCDLKVESHQFLTRRDESDL